MLDNNSITLRKICKTCSKKLYINWNRKSTPVTVYIFNVIINILSYSRTVSVYFTGFYNHIQHAASDTKRAGTLVPQPAKPQLT